MANVVAIIQARMGSIRLPGKVLMPMAGVPMLERVIRRVKEAKLVDRVIVAMPFDDYCDRRGFACIEWGARLLVPQVAEDDVLWRFAKCIDDSTDIIVRVCGDMPLVRPDLIDDCVRRLQDSLCHYVHYTLPTGEVAIETKRGVYPEAFTARALRHANGNVSADNAEWREHVTVVMRAFDIYQPRLVQLLDDDQMDCAVDTQDDFDRVEQLIMAKEAIPA